jgi:hypothetical protein
MPNEVTIESGLTSMSSMRVSQFGMVVEGNFKDDIVYKCPHCLVILATGGIITNSYSQYYDPIVQLLNEVKISAGTS